VEKGGIVLPSFASCGQRGLGRLVLGYEAIAGVDQFDGAAVLVEDLERVAKALRPYGPDRSNVVVAGPVGFVSVLMRMTPEDHFDRQPCLSASRSIITADARVV
jgi:asparagine synthetase B (glutamine-hydrolysing)